MRLPGLGLDLFIGVGPSLATAIYSLTDATGIRGIGSNWVGFDNFDAEFRTLWIFTPKVYATNWDQS